MSISPRFYIPALIAALIVLMIGSVFFWQIHTAISVIESSFVAPKIKTENVLAPLLENKKNPAETDILNQSQSLIYLRQGEIFELKGEWKNAEEKYSLSIASGGGTPALRKLALLQMQRREYSLAGETLKTLRAQNPDSDDMLLLDGLLQLRMGHTDDARRIFNRKPDSPQSNYGLALIDISLHDNTSAKQHLQIAGNSSDPILRSSATTILAAYNEFDLFPNGQDIHLATLLAHALAQVNECETSLPLVSDTVNRQGDYRDAWIVKGYCEFTSDRLKEALFSLERAYSLDPLKPEIQYFLARTHAALGDMPNAITYLQYALVNGFTPEQDARQLLAAYALAIGNTNLALDQYLALTDISNSDFPVYEQYIQLAITQPDHLDNAYATAKVALSKWPDDPAVLTLFAQAAHADGKNDEATTKLDAALKIDPKYAKAQQLLEEFLAKKLK